MKLARGKSLYHKDAPPCDMSDKLHCPNRLKSLQVYSVYPIHTATGQLVSNPNRTTLERRGPWYRLSTSCFQKSDRVPFAVTSTSLLVVEFTIIFSTFRVRRAALTRRLHYFVRLSTILGPVTISLVPRLEGLASPFRHTSARVPTRLKLLIGFRQI